MPMISDWLRSEQHDQTSPDVPDNQHHPRRYYKGATPAADEVRDTALLESINEHNDETQEASRFVWYVMER